MIAKGSDFSFFSKSSICSRKTQDVTQFVHPIQQTGARKGIDGEFHPSAVRQQQAFAFQVDSYLCLWIRLDLLRQFLVRGSVHLHRQQVVFERIVAENIRKGGGDDGAQTKTGQRPGRMFAGRATAEVIPG